MNDDGPILVPTLMNEEPAFIVFFGTKDISLRQVMTMMLVVMIWFVFGWMFLGGMIFGSPFFGLIALSALPVMGIYISVRRKGDERMTYEEWLACRLNFLLSPRYYVREDQEAGGSPDMEMLVWEQ